MENNQEMRYQTLIQGVMKNIFHHIGLVPIFLAFTNIAAGQYQTYLNPGSRTLNLNLPVGATRGDLSVNSKGEALYEIPIFTSPGTAGMVPGIRLLYNSSYPDGVMGSGWIISGLSSISRVPRNFYNDTTRKGIQLTSSDRFALDSNRLVLSSGIYGADQSVYKTEVENFSRITAFGTLGNGPSWFRVETKDGQTIEYGNTSDSKIEANGTSTVMTWRVNKITDVYGNYISFSYNEINGESYLTEIDYTGNSAGIQPYNSVKFFYGTRYDANNPYIGISLVPSTAILTSIRMESEGSLVREYLLKYFSDSFNRTRLNEISESGINSATLNSTIFGWDENDTTFTENDVFEPNVISRFYFGDFNGDGRKDFIQLARKTIYQATDTWKVYITGSDGMSFTLVRTDTVGSGFNGIVIADRDGDGLDDIYLYRETNYFMTFKFEFYKFDGTTNSIIRNQTEDFYLDDIDGVAVITGDFDGNAKEEMILLDADSIYLTVKGITISQGGMPDFSSADFVKTLDFDGDGRTEILVISDNNSYIYQYDNQSQIFSSIYSSSTFPVKDDRIYIGDFNGDKKDDILSYRSGWSLKFSTGVGYVTSANIPSLRNNDPATSALDDNYYIGDFNGDGMDDILESFKDGASSILKTYFSYGNGKTINIQNIYSKAAINQDYLSISAFSGEGFDQVFYYDYSLLANIVNFVSFFTGASLPKINLISDGLDNRIGVKYTRLNEDSAFYDYSSANYPVVTLKNNYRAVSEVTRSTGVFDSGTEVMDTMSYSYEQMLAHLLGKNNLGFMVVKEYSSGTKRYSRTMYSLHPSYYFISSKLVFDNEFIDDTLNLTNWSCKQYGDQVFMPYMSSTRIINPLTGIEISTGYSYDDYGNLTHKGISYRKPADHHLSLCDEDVDFYGYTSYGNWGVPNKPQSSVVSRYVSPNPTVTKTTGFTYDNNGRILTETTYPSTSMEAIKTMTYNTYGGLSSQTLSAQGLTPRTTTFQYDIKNRFITSIEQPDNKTTAYTRDGTTGNPLTETGIDSKVTEYQYDAFGRLKKVITPLSHEITTEIDWETTVTDIPVIYRIESSKPGRPDITDYYDRSGRIIRRESDAYGGTVFQDTHYNANGTKEKISYPYRSGDALKWIMYDYDDFGRLTSETDNSLLTSYYYGHDTVRVTYPTTRTITTVSNYLSDVVEKIDNDNVITSYDYNSFGGVSAISTPGNSVTYFYNEYGLQDSVYNQNSGGEKFIYNAYGELVSHEDARGLITSFQYDVLGRPTQKVSTEGTTQYSYIQSGNGIRQLSGITGPGNVAESYSYDEYSRVTGYSRSISGETTMSYSYAYDQYGNNISVTYPSGLVIHNEFDQLGNLVEIQKDDESPIWQLSSITATGLPVQTYLGPNAISKSYEYDQYENISSIITGGWRQSFNFDGASGNLISRSYLNSDTTFMRTENFQYDTKDRLTTSQVTGLGAKAVTYDDTGNILTKTDAGTYSYSASKVNALETVTFLRGAISTNLQTVAYNSYNKVTEMSEEDYTYSVLYGADGGRIRSRLYEDSILSKTKYYIPGYEKIITPEDTVENHYISSPYGLEAIIVKNGPVETTYLAETDHLGSLIGLTDTAGAYAEKYSYDAWGRRRNPTDWSFTSVPTATITDRGFTGHEHLDEFSLINMGGRLFDPLTSRFLNSDPAIDTRGMAQGLNSYTYCLNNPLKYTDPTGYIRAPLPEQIIDLNLEWFLRVICGHRSSSWFENQMMSGHAAAATVGKTKGIIYDKETGIYRKTDGTILEGEELIKYVNSLVKEKSEDGGVLLSNETDAYNYMWIHATTEKREYAAYITTKGIIVTPADLNKNGTGEFLKYYNPTWNDGALFINFNNKNYQVIGGIHTHWRENGDYGYSFSYDDDLTTKFLNGLPFFSMNFNNTMGVQYFDGQYNVHMDINASRDDVLEGFGITYYIYNYEM
jgi:RHS repeat-associated protein